MDSGNGWAVADGCFEEGMGCLHSLLSHSWAERGGCGRVLKKLRYIVAGQRCVQTEVASLPLICPWCMHPLSLADIGSVIAPVLVSSLL